MPQAWRHLIAAFVAATRANATPHEQPAMHEAR